MNHFNQFRSSAEALCLQNMSVLLLHVFYAALKRKIYTLYGQSVHFITVLKKRKREFLRQNVISDDDDDKCK